MVHHRRGLRRLARNDALVARIEADHATAGLDPRQRAILDYAVKLTKTPGAVQAADVQRLRDAGLGDADILGVAEVTGYYAYVNRIASGLGVPLEGEA